jgi:lipid II isoglutaminyl synthase (glutamine-hydrolysing)
MGSYGTDADDSGEKMPRAHRPPKHAASSPSGAFVPPPPRDDFDPWSPAQPADVASPVVPAPAVHASSAPAGGSGTWGSGGAPWGDAVPPPASTAGGSGPSGFGVSPGDAVPPRASTAGGFGGSPPQASTAAAGRRPAGRGDALRLVWIYPDLLSTYGDRGNLLMLERRARLRGLPVESVELNSDQAVPRQGDIYLLGGGEDLPQVLAVRRLQADGGLAAVAQTGAVIFAVCAGYQLIGKVFGGAQGEPVEGLGILDISSGRGEKRGVGEVVADVDAELGVDRLTGFENHQGVTTLGPGVRPLARVARGVGNGDGTEGAYAGRILGTYLHGPALVRNPGLADLLLSWAAGRLPPIAQADEVWTSKLRAERLAAVSA